MPSATLIHDVSLWCPAARERTLETNRMKKLQYTVRRMLFSSSSSSELNYPPILYSTRSPVLHRDAVISIEVTLFPRITCLQHPLMVEVLSPSRA
jgi:hypothetical protein